MAFREERVCNVLVINLILSDRLLRRGAAPMADDRLSDVVSPSDDLGQPLRRRVSDGRIDALVAAVGSLSTNVALGAQATANLTATVQDIGKRTEATTETLSRITADASASPAGRELLRRAVAVENRVDEHEDALAALATWKTEVQSDLKATWRLMRALATIVSVLSAVLGIVWTLHLLGLF